MNINEIHNLFKMEGYELLAQEYKNQQQKLYYLCPAGHRRYTTWKNWKKGHRCLVCKNQSTRPLLEDVRKSFEKENYLLLSNTYTTNKIKLEYICPSGHKNAMSWADWNVGHYRCPDCANNKRLLIKNIITCVEKEGYKFLSGEYKNNKSILLLECPNGHTFNTYWNNWSNGHRCPVCHSERINIDIINNSFKECGYTLCSKEYIGAHTKLSYVCPKGHKHSISWAAWHQGERCFYCMKAGTSVQEQNLINFIKSLNVDVEVRNRSLIAPYELDIVVHSRNIAIEYCGLYWHSESMGKDRKYHLNKLKMCEKKGYRLITIFEDELLFSSESIFFKLKHMLGVNDANILYARKCIVKEIPTDIVRDFCNLYHLQGYTGANIKLGAFYNNELVAIMTFSKPSIARGMRAKGEFSWELSRFCVKNSYRVVGVASKLLSFFKKKYHWQQIFSYADRRWSVGNVYEKMGFVLDKTTPSNYWYFMPGGFKRIHRFALRKRPDEPKDITEYQLRKAQGYDKIWDCGSLKYVMFNE